MTQLSVNVDHIATLRQARGTSYPSPVEAARLAEGAGAAGITVHLRSDRRHIQDQDVVELSRSVRGKLNLEMAATEEMIEIAIRHRPDQVTLVPERDGEITTEGGLDLVNNRQHLEQAAGHLVSADIQVSLFVDPDPIQFRELADWNLADISGFEINTDHYTRADPGNLGYELDRFSTAVSMGTDLGLKGYAGHGLTTLNVAPIAENPSVLELNIGHWLVARSTLVGIATAVEEMLAAMEDLSI